MKTLKFKSELAALILAGEKTSTWRLFDDKDLQIKETVDFVDIENGKIFATAVLTEIMEVPFGKMSEDDMLGHEKYASKEEMLRTFSKYYQKPVTAETIVKIIKFKLIT